MKITTDEMLDAFNEFSNKTAFYQGYGKGKLDELAYLGLGVAGEAGEVADQIKKALRIHPIDTGTLQALGAPNLVKLYLEMGDLLWYYSQLMRVIGVDLKDIMLLNMYKLFLRLKEDGKLTDADWPKDKISLEYAKFFYESTLQSGVE